eukprot:441021_1
MNLFHIIVIAHIIVNTHAYLSEIAVKTLNKLYNEWNGKYWSPCQWNMTQINNTNQNNKINDQCGLMFSSNLQNFQSVTRIDFASVHTIINNISGTIPPSIVNLSSLQWFRTYYGNLHGTVPSSMCNLTQLALFSIVGGNFHGIVPSCLFKLAIQFYAFIDAPNLSLNSTNIEQLCDNNFITRFVLQLLQIANTNYSGHIPKCIGNYFPNLMTLDLTDLKNLVGSVPSSINNLNKLQSLYLSTLPNIDTTNRSYISLKDLQALVDINLDLSYININITDLCYLDLETIVLYNYDERNLVWIPNECVFSNGVNLQAIQIIGWGFTGSIDESLCTQNKSLSHFEITDTKHFNVSIPDCIANFNQMQTFTLLNNTQLYVLPKHSLNSSFLAFVRIQYNKNLGGSISYLLTNNSYVVSKHYYNDIHYAR